MFKVIANRLEQGHKTSRYPQEAIELSRRFRGLPEIDAACDPALVRDGDLVHIGKTRFRYVQRVRERG